MGGYEGDGWARFAHTVLVDMRAGLAASDDPRRIFRVCLQAASAAGLVGAKRVLDSTPLYDAVATMDAITLIRSAIRGLLMACGEELEAELRVVLSAGDDYASIAKPQIDWDDASARGQLIDSRARDGYACLRVLDGRALGGELAEAAALLVTVLGQDLEAADDGVLRIARRVAPDRVISTVDPEARHGHKTAAQGFDGYKGHVGIDLDSEIITDTVVSAGNVGDAAMAADLIDDLLGAAPAPAAGHSPTAETDTANTNAEAGGSDTDTVNTDTVKTDAADAKAGDTDIDTVTPDAAEGDGGGPAVYGDAAYGSGEFLERLAGAASTRGARPSFRQHPAACSPKTLSTSTSTPIP